MLQFLHRRPKQYKEIWTKAALAEHLDWALAVELSTVPPYLAALYSIQDQTSEAYQLIRSVVIEEMLHMMLVCNMRNAIGDDEVGLHPDLVGQAARYPTYMPHHAAGGPYIQLQAASVAQVRTVFLGIELPVASGAPAGGDNYETIGQFYDALAAGFRNVARTSPDTLFTGDRALQQVNTYFGGGGGRLKPVVDLPSALLAIREIVEQGEGASRDHPPRPGDEGFGILDNYGRRSDGTIGPIVGASWEASHYAKFETIANGTVPIGAVWPMQPNPDTNQLKHALRDLSELFDDVYGLMLRGLQATLNSPESRALFFGGVLPLMHSALPQLALALMQTPLYPGADPSLGPNAGPAFLVGEATRDVALARCEGLLAEATISDDPLQRAVWVPALTTVRDVLLNLPPIA
jgi:Ferritin-like